MDQKDQKKLMAEISAMITKDENYYKMTDGPWKHDSHLRASSYDDKPYAPWGEENDYPETLVYYAKRSPVLSGILRKECTRVAGTVIQTEDGKPIDSSHPLYLSGNGMTLKQLVDALAIDAAYLNTFSFSVEYTKSKDRVAGLYHVPVTTIRSGKMYANGFVKDYYLTPDWKAVNAGEVEPTRVSTYSPDRTGKSSLIYDRTHNVADWYYSDVQWDSALPYVILDYEIGVFQVSGIRNGMTPGLIISYPQESSPQRARRIKETFEKNLKGSGNAGKAIFLFAPTSDAVPTITQISTNDLDKMYSVLTEQINQKITLATGIPRVISGLESATGLADAGNALREAESQWFRNDLLAKQSRIQAAINRICEDNGYPLISIENERPTLLDYGVSDAILQYSFSPDEIREAMGYQKLSEIDGTA